MPFIEHLIKPIFLSGAPIFALQAQGNKVLATAPVLTNTKPEIRPQPRAHATPEIQHDDANARRQAMEARRGGNPSQTHLEGKAKIMEAEARKWSAKAPLRLPVGVAPQASLGGIWVNIGPRSLDSGLYSPSTIDLNSGRLTAIVTHPTDPKTLYVASAGGGVWKCTNADVASQNDWIWTPITDALPISGSEGNVPVGDLAMDPDDPNTLYMGLGDRYGGGPAVGFWITHDGGTSWARGWTNTPGPDSMTHKILPLGGGKIVVFTANRGLYRSEDGGATFLRTGPNLDTGMRFQPTSLIRFSATDLAVSGGIFSSSGATPKWMYSSDGGVTWADSSFDATITSDLRLANDANLAGGEAGDGVAYGLVVGATSSFAQGVVRTVDKGHTWAFIPSNQAFSASGDGRQSYYNQFIVMDPTNSSNVFIGANFGSYRSLDGGLSWTLMTHWLGNGAVYAHADFHAGAFSKTGPTILYSGNDGGLCVFRDPYRATPPNNGAGPVPSDPTFVDNRRNKGLTTQLLYSITSTQATNVPGASDLVLVGAQDNSTGARIGSTADFHVALATGDGTGTLIHSTDAAKVIAFGNPGYAYYCTNFGSPNPTWQTSGGDILSSLRNFFSPIIEIPTNPDGALIAGTKAVLRSLNFGQTFTAMPTTGIDPAALLRIPAASFHSATTVAVSGVGPNADDPPGYITQNDGISWSPFGPLPNGDSPWNISFSPINPNVLYVTAQGYSLQSSHVFKSTNLGVTWTAIDVNNGYPFGIPANVIRESRVRPNVLYVGTDLGVYVSPDGGASWSRLGAGLPYIRVEDLYEAPDGSFLRIATYGRGAWDILLSAPSAPDLSTFTPLSGPPGTSVVLTGSGFTGATSVSFNGTPSASFTVNSDSQITATVPSGATSGSISVVTPGGSVFSTASFTVTAPGTAPLITQQPSNASITAGQTATFTVTATGTAPLAYQWSRNSVAINGATSSSYTTPTASLADNGASFTVTVSNSVGSVTSAAATLAVSAKTSDLNGDGAVDVLDFAVLAAAYGARAGDAAYNAVADLNGDGVVDDSDITLFLAAS